MLNKQSVKFLLLEISNHLFEFIFVYLTDYDFAHCYYLLQIAYVHSLQDYI